MNVSLIIPTFNAEKYLPTLFTSLKNQTVSFELIIIDSSSTDNTIQIAKQYTNNIISIPQVQFDHGGTRTKAAKTASGDILIFMTQDALPVNKKSIENIISIFKNTEVAATYGKQVPYPDTSLFAQHLREFNYQNKSYLRTIKDKNKHGIKTTFLSDSFAAYRKTVLEEVNWFKDGLIVGEDSHIGAKILLKNYTLGYSAEAKVYHSHNYSIIQEFKRYFDIGVFHKREKWILETFGKAEGEGAKYIKSELKFLIKHGAYHLIPEFFIRNGMKYLGYKLGTFHSVFSTNLNKKLSMHTFWWDT